MGTQELRWPDRPSGSERHVAAMQTALTVAARVHEAADGKETVRPGDDLDQAAGLDPLGELAELTQLLRWLSGVRDDLIYAARKSYEERGNKGRGSWQELADALGITRTPTRQRYELVVEGKRRGGRQAVAWDAQHRERPTDEQRRNDPRPPQHAKPEHRDGACTTGADQR